MAGTRYKGSELKDVDQFLEDSAGLESDREHEIGQHIGYRYDVNLLPDYDRLTPFLNEYMEVTRMATPLSLTAILMAGCESPTRLSFQRMSKTGT